jgi:hypothetical protein
MSVSLKPSFRKPSSKEGISPAFSALPLKLPGSDTASRLWRSIAFEIA